MAGVAVAWAGSEVLLDRGESTPRAEATLQFPQATPQNPPFGGREPGYPAISTVPHGQPTNPAPLAHTLDDRGPTETSDIESQVTPNVDMGSRAAALSLDAALAELAQDDELAEAWAAQHLPGPLHCSSMCLGPTSDPRTTIESLPVPVAPPMVQPPGLGPANIEAHVPSPEEAGPSAPTNEGDLVLIPRSDSDPNGVPYEQQPAFAPGLTG
jgi:hypothetical protein